MLVAGFYINSTKIIGLLLVNGTYVVRVNQYALAERQIKKGVAQGSVLTQTYIYTTDIPKSPPTN